MTYLSLFWSFFQIGLFSFGGGYASLPLIQHQVVDLHSWLTMTQFSDIITISQMTPGPVAINSATFVGIQIAGIPGAIIATLGCITPSCILITMLAFVYYHYRSLSTLQGVLSRLRPAVVAMFAGAGVSLFQSAIWATEISLTDTDWIAAVIFVLALVILRWKKVNPITVMVSSGVLGLILYTIVQGGVIL